jgi:predicted ATPase
MLNEIRLINYKAFLCEKIPLEPITVFIGANGSGKSTIASALYALSTTLRLGLLAAFPEGLFSFRNLRNFEPLKCGYKHPPIGFGVSGAIEDFQFDYDIIFERELNSPTGFFIDYEGIKISGESFQDQYTIGTHPEIAYDLPTKGGQKWIRGLETNPKNRQCVFLEADEKRLDDKVQSYLKRIKKYMHMMSRYQFLATSARMPCERYDGSGRPPFLKPDASNLAEVAQYLQEEQRGQFAELKSWIRKYAEGGNKIVDLGVATHEDKVFLNFFEEGKDRKSFEVRGPLVSDGYWVFAAFACLACSPTLPSIAFFEEPESHLHPHKLPVLCEVFKTMTSLRRDPCQVLISSHSPYFLDLFKESPQSVIFLKNGKEKRLTDIPDYEKILSMYSLGEAWYSNVFEWGNPT